MYFGLFESRDCVKNVEHNFNDLNIEKMNRFHIVFERSISCSQWVPTLTIHSGQETYIFSLLKYKNVLLLLLWVLCVSFLL